MLQLRLLRRNVFFCFSFALAPWVAPLSFRESALSKEACCLLCECSPVPSARPFLSVGQFLSATLRFMGLKSTLMALPCVHRLESASERIAFGLVIRPSQTAMQSRCLFQDPRQVCWKLRWCLGVRPCQLFVLLFAFM